MSWPTRAQMRNYIESPGNSPAFSDLSDKTYVNSMRRIPGPQANQGHLQEGDARRRIFQTFSLP
ncbi:MAG: hypothetical protein KDK23_05540 [Leptospiraceae bacterium]|nr:hypothetical protein [Leptospiraceae bacterium]